MTKQKLVVIGCGMAPGRALEHLIERDPDAYEITIFNAEPRVNYDRIMLSPVLSGEKAFEDIVIHGDDWYERHGVTLHRGCPVERIDRDAKLVHGANGVTEEYDRLIVATGSNPFIIPMPGHDLPGVVAYRDYDDVSAMLAAAKEGGSAVVIGGGLLGLEAAAGLKSQGMDVTVVHLSPTIMDRQLDPAAAYLLQRDLEKRGIRVVTRANTKEVVAKIDERGPRAGGIKLEDGTILQADIVVMAVGIRPSVALAKVAGLEVNRGIVVDDGMATSDPSILAVGECAEHRGMVYGLVAPLYDMAKVAADRLLGGDAEYQGSVVSTKLKVTGVAVFSAGDFAEADNREDIVFRDATRGVYKRVVLENNKIIGAVMYGDTADGGWFFDLMKRGEDVSDMRDTLIFGPAYAGGTPLDPTAAVAALADSSEICGCNGVCKGTIVEAIETKELGSLEAVRSVTKASASCGSCTGLVEQLLSHTLGDKYESKGTAPVCGCTDLGHGEVRRLIKAKELKSIPAVMQELEWSTPNGCHKCRVALNYYLVADWPGEYVDDGRSRFINERVHANIQKDGTYSVVPRMWGGMTNSRELRAIADVVDKYAIPAVKCTGGARIDMLGVKKEDLPGVWSDLNEAGLVSGHAYGKALRTVKSCVGTDWCRFGTQDAMGLGVRVEKFMWGAWTPGKVKMAVSGCPRNCAESTCKDVGVICVDSGYEIHIGGASGLDIQGTDLLTKVETEDQALEMIVAVTQLYREQGWYLERIYKWVRRVGLETIHAQVVEDAEHRAELFRRFVHSQKFAQHDPWKERVEGVEAHEFAPMARIMAEAAE